ncbi:hypothetical protein CDAR_99831 [Caerostris darwini]|uniref:Ribosomal protein S10 n=1 Tax=Caerostris darwini TaxID=1538125 RepID=A0AAV4X186_9ARAC|nr:hypothetical protein CDAR_99831 [Caerostris darwini]
MDNFLEACPSTAAVNYKTSFRRKRHGVSWQPFSAKLYIKEPGRFHLQEDKDLDRIVCNRLLREKGSRLLTRVGPFRRWNYFDKRKWRHSPRQEALSLGLKLKFIIEIYFSPEKPNQCSLPFNQTINSPQTRAWIIFWKPVLVLLQLIIILLPEENATESHGSLFLHKLYIKEPGKFHLQEDKDLDRIVCNRLLREKESRLLTRVHTFRRWK